MSLARRLVVMRHAKSSWASEADTVHDRPLNDRGRRDAPRIAKHLVDIGWSPALILSSDSRRTRETYEGMKPSFAEDVMAEFHRSMYHAGLEAIQHEVVGVDDRIESLLVLGHNPGWEDVVHHLSGEEVILKTANAALLEGSGDSWLDAINGRWRLVDVVRARDL